MIHQNALYQPLKGKINFLLQGVNEKLVDDFNDEVPYSMPSLESLKTIVKCGLLVFSYLLNFT